MLAGAYTMLVKGHISIGVLVDRFSERTQAIFDSVAYLICPGVAIVAVWQTLAQATYLIEVFLPNYYFSPILSMRSGVLL